jgi:hypothetical protein
VPQGPRSPVTEVKSGPTRPKDEAMLPIEFGEVPVFRTRCSFWDLAQAATGEIRRSL